METGLVIAIVGTGISFIGLLLAFYLSYLATKESRKERAMTRQNQKKLRDNQLKAMTDTWVQQGISKKEHKKIIEKADQILGKIQVT